MLEQWKKKWVAALRSGEYEQGEGRLVQVYPGGRHKFCCLGVLCDILPKEKCDWKCVGQGNSEVWIAISRGAKGMSVIPENVRKWLEITQIEQWQLWRMNDVQHKSLKDIARWIEINL